MLPRRLFPELEEHLNQKYITVVTGMRRVGKSTALHYLLGKVPHDNKIYLDLERVENRFIFQQLTYKDVQIDLEIQGIDFSKSAVIALDEIQLVPHITSIIKYFYDTFTIKFLLTGSSSFYLRNHFSESLAGRKHIFELFPLDFLEFLWFRGENTEVLERFSMQPWQQGIYLKFKDLYEEYLRFGGFPDVVLATTEKEKVRTLKDVINSYIDLDIRLVADFEVSGTLYKLIRLLATRSGTLLEISKIAAVLGIDRTKTTGYLDLLEKTYFIHTIAPFSRSIDREISKRKKIYFADTGILQQLAQTSSGQVFENQIFLQFFRQGEVNYYQKKSGQEIDFVLNQQMACEVKETPHAGDLTVLKNRASALQLPTSILVGKHPPGDGFREFVWAGMVF